MKDIEIVIFQDKSWVRFTEYQKVKQENEQLQKNNKHIQDLIEAERQRQEECNDVHLRDIATLEKEKCELLGIIQKKDELIKNLICCANCKHGTQGDYDCFENCGSCHAIDCECEIKSPTKNSSGKYHDWNDKCDKWELAE